MENKAIILAGLSVGIGLVIAGAMVPLAVGKYRAAERYVSVKGLCEREVAADKVIWPIQYKAVGNDLSAVISELEQKNRAIHDFLREGGIEDSEVTTSMPLISDKYTLEYGSDQRVFRYLATSTITVCTTRVDKVLELMNRQSDLLHRGIVPQESWNVSPVFSFEGLNAIKPDMIQEATMNARESAQKFAMDSGSRLGKIRTASQGTFSITDRDSNTPQIKKVRVVTSVDYYLKN